MKIQKESNSDSDSSSISEKSEELKNKNNKINIEFISTGGSRKNLFFDENITIGKAIKNFLISNKVTDLDSIKGNIIFIYDCRKIDINDNTPIKEFFKNESRKKIYVNDVTALIGA